VIPKAVDEYHQQLKAYPTQDIDAQVNNPVWHIHSGHVPESKMVVSFAMLLNLASVAGAKDAAGLWGFIKKYAPDASPATHPDLDAAAGYALRYFNDKIAPNRTYRLPTDTERAAILDLRARLEAYEANPDKYELLPLIENAASPKEEALQTACYAVGKKYDFDPLRDWFKALYEVLMGASEGPRFGGFIALYGIPETIALIDKALNGDLIA
jgi:lysyl-tRNA synthetase class 1